MLNLSANMLGLDNAATPLGLKAMAEMQSLNANKKVASNSQIMFLVLNTSGLTIIPISIMLYRSELGAENPSDVFLPILLSTLISTIGGIIITSIFQKIKLFNKNIYFIFYWNNRYSCFLHLYVFPTRCQSSSVFITYY